MYLKRLEMQGFKSFADKTILEFRPGITGVIGPNGSGKSNISDAIRWILGEQSMKSLRGNKTQDIIFAGTQNRKSLGFAEASLVFDNIDGSLPIEYSEVTVNLTPFEWVEMFRNAEFVFTGTFHGAVFSILNRRQFKVYLTNESRIKKVTALLSELQITNRPIKEDFCFDLESMKSEINYEKVYDVIEQNRQSSKQYLKDAIGMAKK